MRRISLLSLAVLLLLAAPARADDGQEKAERLFQEAYVQEVVGGQVAEAAQHYLTLARDEGLSLRLRAEARFRFAVCATLLGRADEARVWLGGLIQDEEVPASHRERAKAYLESLSAVGVGSELDKRLQDLVFQVARADPGADVPVYRDFEILGERVVPFLKQLLGHEDEKLRQHAFRILCRMGVPGMGKAWKPTIPWTGLLWTNDLRDYFDIWKHPEETSALEANLLALPPEQRSVVLYQMLRRSHTRHPYKLYFSLAFARELTEHEKTKPLAFTFLNWSSKDRELWDQIQAWLEGDDKELARGAADFLLDRSLPPEPYAAALFPGIVRVALTNPAPILRNEPLVTAQTPPALVDALDEVVSAGESWEGPSDQNPLRRGVPVVLSKALKSHPPEGKDLVRLEGIYRRWMRAELALAEEWQRTHPNHAFAVRGEIYRMLYPLFAGLPAEKGATLITWLLGDALKGRGQTYQILQTVPLDAPRHLAIALAALRGAEAGERTRVSQWLEQRIRQLQGSVMATAVIDALPSIVAAVDPTAASRILPEVTRLAALVPTKKVKRTIAEILPRFNDLAPSLQKQVVDALALRRKGNQSSYAPEHLAKIVVPAAIAAWEELGPSLRSLLVNKVAHIRRDMATGKITWVDEQELLARFIGEHVSLLEGNGWETLARLPDLFHPEEWLPLIPAADVGHTDPLPQETKDVAARRIVGEGKEIGESFLRFVKTRTSPAVSRDIFDGLLASDSVSRYGPAIDELNVSNGTPATPKALETVLGTLLEAKDADLPRLARVARMLVHVRPSPKLFPAASELLRSGRRPAVVEGIYVANLLGHETLIGDLVPLLSSLDSDVRRRAKEAIDSIREVRRIQQEEKAKATEK